MVLEQVHVVRCRYQIRLIVLQKEMKIVAPSPDDDSLRNACQAGQPAKPFENWAVICSGIILICKCLGELLTCDIENTYFIRIARNFETRNRHARRIRQAQVALGSGASSISLV